MNRQYGRKDEKGTTLLEVLAALLLLAVLTSAVLAIFSPTALWIVKAGNETAASNYASAILEELRDKREQLYTVNCISPEDLNLNQSYKPTVPADITAAIAMDFMSGFNHLYKVEVLITWTDGRQPQELKMVSIIRKY